MRQKIFHHTVKNSSAIKFSQWDVKLKCVYRRQFTLPQLLEFYSSYMLTVQKISLFDERAFHPCQHDVTADISVNAKFEQRVIIRSSVMKWVRCYCHLPVIMGRCVHGQFLLNLWTSVWICYHLGNRHWHFMHDKATFLDISHDPHSPQV